ncbi:TPA: hypothetical protein ACM938_004853 [Escherichia coli]|nr:hypothetical protein [Salmonella enterica]EJW9403053.1 hypothetical protein [Salmonella enterica subsp. enterica serovar Kentucky]EDB9173923.1 hypothetical protein [Salmonella enterica]EJZ7368210.1 hypothetical protein [Salmonella enterica subsp. enterica serovar Kentucky]EKA1075191.1 hypothetical protein [Salmonella enterica subsp. enterica serovar Kentucky]
MTVKAKRTTFTLNPEMSELLRKATLEATKKANLLIKQTDLVNYLLKHHLNDAIKAVSEEKTVP